MVRAKCMFSLLYEVRRFYASSNIQLMFFKFNCRYIGLGTRVMEVVASKCRKFSYIEYTFEWFKCNTDHVNEIGKASRCLYSPFQVYFRSLRAKLFILMFSKALLSVLFQKCV